MPSNDQEAIIHAFFLEFFKAMSNLQSINKELVEKEGISYVCWQIMAVIWINNNYKPMTITNIANTLAITRQAVQKQAKVLIKEKILEPVVNLNDKRAPCYALTTKGVSITRCMRKHAYDKWMVRAFKNTNLEEILNASILLKQLTNL